LNRFSRSNVDFLGDGLLMNLTKLTVEQVDWVLKQIVQVMLALKAPANALIYRYGEALYRHIGTPDSMIWRGDFSELQREWIKASTAR
jgi:hypothetical protein